LQVGNQPGLHSDLLSQKQKTKNKKPNKKKPEKKGSCPKASRGDGSLLISLIADF
jgi:hypothetical protein